MLCGMTLSERLSETENSKDFLRGRVHNTSYYMHERSTKYIYTHERNAKSQRQFGAYSTVTC